MGRWYKPGNASVRPMKRRERSSDSMNREHETPEFLDRPLDLAWDVRVFVAPRVVPQRLSCGDGPTSWFPSRNQFAGSASSKLRPTIVAKRTVHTRGTAVTSYPPPPTAIHRPPQRSDESPSRIRPTAS